MAKKVTEIGYAEAQEELEGILQQMEEGEVSVDELAALVQRAGELIQHCKKKLRQTEQELHQSFEKFDKTEPDESAAVEPF